MSIFTTRDQDQMAALGISTAEAERQLHLFENPPPPIRLDRPARVGDGILRIAEDEREALVARAGGAAEVGELGRFVPASGAASRMFRDLEAVRLGEAEGAAGEAGRRFLEHLEDFAFYEDLAAALAGSGQDLEALRRAGRAEPILDHLLTGAGGAGLGYAELPKGLLRFHRYPQERRTAFEEHLVEAVETVRDATGTCRLHFTVSPEHRDGFERRLAEARELYGRRFDTRFDVSFSHQSHATDTLAVDRENRPFRLDDGTLLFRPGGHGALLANLAGLGGGVVFVKNIDNVVPDAAKEVVIDWKRLLAGQLLTLRDRAFELLDRLEASGEPAVVDEAARFLAHHLYRSGPLEDEEAPVEERRRRVIDLLDRPLRVCGVVENVGEPGGGPFWVREPEGGLSLQIVEASQVAGDDEAQQAILGSSTHFNPVDLVCSLSDRRGKPYPLDDYVDPATIFIAEKSHAGRPVKALERPGLWNGAMAGWNTVFAEVPLATFAPVKTVFDLLRPEHQTGVKPKAA